MDSLSASPVSSDTLHISYSMHAYCMHTCIRSQLGYQHSQPCCCASAYLLYGMHKHIGTQSARKLTDNIAAALPSVETSCSLPCAIPAWCRTCFGLYHAGVILACCQSMPALSHACLLPCLRYVKPLGTITQPDCSMSSWHACHHSMAGTNWVYRLKQSYSAMHLQTLVSFSSIVASQVSQQALLCMNRSTPPPPPLPSPLPLPSCPCDPSPCM